VKILFLADNYPPEVNAPAARTHAHCREWVRAGAEVTVITCAPNFPRGRVFPGYRNRLCQTEVLDGIQVIRVWSYMAPNAGFARRILDYLSFAASAGVASLREDFDVLVATSPQFFTAVAGLAVGFLKRRPWVFELRDLWPESIVATGAMNRGRTIELLERLEMTLYRSADQIVAVTESFRDQLQARGVDARKIRVVTNGVDRSEFDGVTREAGPASKPFRVGYLGTHGLAHGLEVVLEAAPMLAPYEVEFVLVGDGARKPWLEEEARKRDVAGVRFHDPVPREAIPHVLDGFDACLVPLRDSPTFTSVIPSKIFEAAAARRPILLGVRGEAARIVEAHGAGLTFVPESPSELAAAIRRLIREPGLYATLQRGCEDLAAAYDREVLAKSMLAGLEELARPAVGTGRPLAGGAIHADGG
jgi:glycosyltransferase involved in cell wall biosynthesis